jgi:hypothetical protein
MTDQLVLHLKREYFDAIKRGDKLFEYRLRTPYWKTRLVGRNYKTVLLLCGYPKFDDEEKTILCRWQGYEPQIIRHPHFGEKPVHVFAIRVDDKIST